MKPFLFLPLSLALVLAIAAQAGGGLYSVRSPLKLVERSSGREFTLPANQGFTYTILEISQNQSRLRVFDREGKELDGDFAVASESLQMARVHDIGEGLKAAAEGAKGKEPPCCDVKEDPEDRPEPKRKEAAPPVPAPKLVAAPVATPSAAPTQPSAAPIAAPAMAVAPAAPPAEAVEVAHESEKPQQVVPPVSAPPPPLKKPLQPRRPAVVLESHSSEEEYRPNPVTPADLGLVPRESEAYYPLPPRRPTPAPSPASRARRARPNPVTPDEIARSGRDDYDPKAPVPGAPDKGGYCAIYQRFKGKVPDAPLRQILVYLSRDPGRYSAGRAITKRNLISFADYSQPSEKERYYQLDLDTGEIIKEKVSHGSGCYRLRNGQRVCRGGSRSMLERCGTDNNFTRAGFYKLESTYYSSHGSYSGWPALGRGRNGLRMRGLTPGVNWDSEEDGIVMHEATYNFERVGTPMGRSSGCVAFAPGCLKPLVSDLQGGSLFYSYAPQCGDQMSKALNQVRGWENFCE